MMNICVVNVFWGFFSDQRQTVIIHKQLLFVTLSDFHNKSLLSIKLHLTHVNIFIHGINYQQLHVPLKYCVIFI